MWSVPGSSSDSVKTMLSRKWEICASRLTDFFQVGLHTMICLLCLPLIRGDIQCFWHSASSRQDGHPHPGLSARYLKKMFNKILSKSCQEDLQTLIIIIKILKMGAQNEAVQNFWFSTILGETTYISALQP